MAVDLTLGFSLGAFAYGVLAGVAVAVVCVALSLVASLPERTGSLALGLAWIAMASVPAAVALSAVAGVTGHLDFAPDKGSVAQVESALGGRMLDMDAAGLGHRLEEACMAGRGGFAVKTAKGGTVAEVPVLVDADAGGCVATVGGNE